MSTQNKLFFLAIPIVGGLFLLLYKKSDMSETPVRLTTETSPFRLASGRTFQSQSGESYCLECVEGHTMIALTEMRHALDRYRTAQQITPGVTEKVRVAISELQGIEEDARNIEDASPEVKKGVNEILDEVRWIRKDYGSSGIGLTVGEGTELDLQELRTRIQGMQEKAYGLVKKCPTCRVRL